MNRVPYADSNGRLSVRVNLSNACKVYLVDSLNFQKYKTGQGFSGYGGYYTRTPVDITVNKPGRWYLLVIGGGKYSYSFY